MGIQSSVNNLLAQVQRLATFYVGKDKVDQITGDTTATKKEAQIQTDIAAGNAPMKDGKVDPEWLQKRRDEMYKGFADDYNNRVFDNDGKLTDFGKEEAQNLYNQNRKGVKFGDKYVNDFYNDSRVQNYLKPFIEKYEKDERLRNVLFGTSPLDSVIEAQSPNSELKNEVARKVAKISVKSRTNNINKSKADFKKHLIGVKKDKGSELN